MKRQTSRAILITQKNEICLIKRVKNEQEYYVTPGGGVEENETPSQALVRELKEEIGSTIQNNEEHIPVFTQEQDNQVDYFFLCYELTRGQPTGSEHAVSSATNNYQVVDMSVEKAKEINLVPSALKNKILDIAEKAISQGPN